MMENAKMTTKAARLYLQEGQVAAALSSRINRCANGDGSLH